MFVVPDTGIYSAEDPEIAHWVARQNPGILLAIRAGKGPRAVHIGRGGEILPLQSKALLQRVA